MKRLFLSAALLLSMCVLAIAQRKTQFGITVQAGNYLQARQERQAIDYVANNHQLTMGVLAGLGVYVERTLCPRVALYGGLQFFQSAFREQFVNVYYDQAKRGSADTYKATHRFKVSQVAVPIKVQLWAGKNRQLAFSIGAAPSLAMANLRSDPANDNIFSGGCIINVDDSYYTNDELRAFDKFQVLYTTGLHYQLDAYNSLGLELWLARKVKAVDPSFLSYSSYQLPTNPYQMRSLQVALRHTWHR